MSASPLVEAWRMSQDANLFLLDALRPAWLADRYGARTRTVAAQFAHVHGVRLRWLRHAAPRLVAGVAGFERGAEPGKRELRRALVASSKPVERFLEDCEAGGRVPSWKGPPVTFLGYLVAHEAHHRGLVLVALRVCGHSPPEEVVYGLWDWGKKVSRGR